MLKVLCTIFLSFPVGILCQAWHNKACLENHLGYVERLAQETIYKLEIDVKFCNLKVDDFNQTINNQMYSWHVSGSVQYTDNFLISIQNVHFDKVSSMVTRRLANEVPEYQAGVLFTLVFNHAKIGFNALVKLDNQPEQRYTVDYLYDSISFPISITRLLNTNETTYTSSRAGSVARLEMMNFLPSTNVSQVVRRNFESSSISSSFTKWASQTILPIMQELEDIITFPKIRLDGCK
ncbi:uncharacterized protein LOC123720009 [Pieris brassicae]|uniref:uncharacterized protein LOC123720009 n=1 Tax=Pieris brassicae TaxID=7116 RepID=UPI001E662839|nr:uncharacterized protein LOC123720009 [Pieris brassicae]